MEIDMIGQFNRRAFLAGAAGVAIDHAGFPRALAQEGAKRGGTVSIYVNSEQRVLNPALRASTGVSIIGAKIVEPLIDLGPDGRPDPRLAFSWSSSADGLSITFKLRPNVKWHDGVPFTSADVQFVAMEIWKKHLNYGATLQLYLDAVDTPDELTAIFRYSRPMPMNLLLRALPELGYVVPKHVFDGSNVLQNPANAAPIGTGPFKFSKYERGQYVMAERNEEYWAKDKPYVDRLIWRFIPDRSAAMAAIESGQINVATFPSLAQNEIERFSNDKRFELTTRGSESLPFHNTVEFNFRRKELADLRVRRAIIHALDVDFFCKNFLYGFGKRAQGPIPSTSTAFFTAGAPDYPFDKKRAEALLEEAGYRRGADGIRFAVKLLPAPWGEDVTLWATFMQQSLQQVGIKVELVRYDAAGYLTNVYKDWNFDLATGWHQYRVDPAVSTTVWYRSGSPKGTPWTNQWGWQSDSVDRLIDDAAVTTEPTRRKALYAELTTKVCEELPVWMAIERQFISLGTRSLQNAYNNPHWAWSHWSDLWVA
jgi:peptide/nickel transport system substrate-binding protein